MLTGRCLCGGVRYEIDGEIGSVVCCHCSQCRRASGTAFATNASVRAEHFRLIAGQDLLTEYESSPGKFRAFRARRVDRPLGQHEAVARAEAKLLALGAEGDLAVDHPEALVVIVRVGRVVGVGRIDPEERLEAVGRETRGERALRWCVGAVPWNSFETHGADSPFDYRAADSSVAARIMSMQRRQKKPSSDTATTSSADFGSRHTRHHVGVFSEATRLTGPSGCASCSTSSAMMSLHRSMHSSQM